MSGVFTNILMKFTEHENEFYKEMKSPLHYSKYFASHKKDRGILQSCGSLGLLLSKQGHFRRFRLLGLEPHSLRFFFCTHMHTLFYFYHNINLYIRKILGRSDTRLIRQCKPRSDYSAAV